MPTPARQTARTDRAERLARFLTERLTDELAALWAREATRTGTARPGLAAQVAVLDDVLATLAAGGLPCDRELRLLLVGYAHHPDHDPAWLASIGEPTPPGSRPGR